MRKPKRARSGYIIFMGDVRGRLKEQFPDAPVQDITRKIGDLWSKLALDDRRPYEERAAAEKLVQVPMSWGGGYFLASWNSHCFPAITHKDALIAQWTHDHPDEVRALEQAKHEKRTRNKVIKAKRGRTDPDSGGSSARSSFSDTAVDQ